MLPGQLAPTHFAAYPEAARRLATAEVPLWRKLPLAFLPLLLRIEDNGRGFDPDAVPSGHLGVSIMRERAAAIGAEIDIRSAAGAGVTVEARYRTEP